MRAVCGAFLTRLALAASLLCATASTAPAEDAAPTAAASVTSDAEWKDCSSDDPALSIAVCTTILERGDRETTANRVMTLGKRGVSHYRRSEFDAAIQDRTAALLFDPNLTLALRGCFRGLAFSAEREGGIAKR